jgi:Helix-turn-helix domain
VGEEKPRGDDAAKGRQAAASSGWVTTQQAAKALDISPRTVRWHIERGNLEAKSEGEGVQRAWLVSIDSLQALRDTRQAAAPSPGDYRAATEDADSGAAIPGGPIRELADRLVEEARRAEEVRVRLELSERTESTLRAELAEERQRREETERERDELRQELAALKESREEPAEAPETPSEASSAPAEASGEAQEPAELQEERKGWFRRFFGL